VVTSRPEKPSRRAALKTQPRLTLRLAALALLALPWAGCGYVEDAFKTCEDVPVDLVNSPQTVASFHIVTEEESPSSANLLESGASRRIQMCLDKGYRKSFRVFRANDFSSGSLANVYCVASKSSYESVVPRVVWTPVGLRCENW
jgi:hypothetical protein